MPSKNGRRRGIIAWANPTPTQATSSVPWRVEVTHAEHKPRHATTEGRHHCDLFALRPINLARQLGNGDSTYAHHMKDARFTIPTPDTKGDVYEYMLAKIATAGQNGQFRTPRHVMTAPQPTDIICDPDRLRRQHVCC